MQISRKKISSVLVVILLSQLSIAEECASDFRSGEPFSDNFDQGFNSCFYVGLGVGASRKVPVVENELGYGRGDDIDVAAQLYLGYRLNSFWFVELGYSQLGQSEFISRSLNATAVSDPEIEYDYQGVGAYLGRYLMSNKNYGWNIFARAGYVHTRADSDNEGILSSGSSDSLLVGGGIDYRPKNSAWFFRGSADYYEEDVQVATLSVGRYLGLNILGFGKKAEAKVSSKNGSQPLEVDSKINSENDIADGAVAAIPNDNSISDENDLPLPSKQREADCKILDEVADGITFAPGSSELVEQSSQVLESYAKALIRNPDLLVELAAHTSDNGNASEAIALTTAQAETAVEYLINLGVSDGQLIAKGYGAKRPIASGDGANDQARNRRIAFRVMNVGACFESNE